MARQGRQMNPDVIEAMCRAYWNERGSFKWENEGEQYKETIRARMRAAVRAQEAITHTALATSRYVEEAS